MINSRTKWPSDPRAVHHHGSRPAIKIQPSMKRSTLSSSGGSAMLESVYRMTMAVVLFTVMPAAFAQADGLDWPMYNHDVLGTRHNPAERAISKGNAGQLEEKWRFPAKGSEELVGVIHATPIVVDGYVYFGTATDPTFYKLTPDGKVRWSYQRVKRPESAKNVVKQPRPSKTQGVP